MPYSHLPRVEAGSSHVVKHLPSHGCLASVRTSGTRSSSRLSMCCRWRTPWGSAPGRRSSRCTNQRLPRQTAPSPSRLTGRCTCAKRAALRVERRRLAERRPGRSLPHITKPLHSPFVPVGIRRGHAMSRAKTAALHAAAGERRTPSPPQGASVAQSPACLPRTRRGKWTHRRRTRQALAAGEMALQTAGSLGNFLQLACQ